MDMEELIDGSSDISPIDAATKYNIKNDGYHQSNDASKNYDNGYAYLVLCMPFRTNGPL